MNFYYSFKEKFCFPVTKIPLVMRLSFFLLFVSIGVVLANESYAQSAVISVDVNNKAIADILDMVEQQSEFTFIYDTESEISTSPVLLSDTIFAYSDATAAKEQTGKVSDDNTPERENTGKDPGTKIINSKLDLKSTTTTKTHGIYQTCDNDNPIFHVASHNYESKSSGEVLTLDSDFKIFPRGRGKITVGKNLTDTKPLIIIDGKRESVDIENINAEKIHSISIYKDKAAIEKYGEEAKDGVIFITTYEGRKALLESSAYDIKGTVVDESGHPVGNASVKITETETYTDQNGMFTLRIVPGDWLNIEAEGYDKKRYQTDEDVKITSAQITLKKEN